MILEVEGTFPAPFLSHCTTWDNFSRCLSARVPFPPALHIQILPFSEVLLSCHLFCEAFSDFSYPSSLVNLISFSTLHLILPSLSLHSPDL